MSATLQRKALGEQLEDLLDALLKTGLVRGRAQIIEARVPIIKCCMALGGPEGLAVDICIGAANGAAAVGFIRRQVNSCHLVSLASLPRASSRC